MGVQSITQAEAWHNLVSREMHERTLAMPRPEPPKTLIVTCRVLAQSFLAAAAVRRHWSDGQRGRTRQRRSQVSFASEGLVAHRDACIFGEEERQI